MLSQLNIAQPAEDYLIEHVFSDLVAGHSPIVARGAKSSHSFLVFSPFSACLARGSQSTRPRFPTPAQKRSSKIPGAMQIPTDPGKVRAPAHGKAPPPVLNAGPSDDGSSHRAAPGF